MQPSLYISKSKTTWVLENPRLLEGPQKIRWDTLLPLGGTRHQRHYLLSSAKSYMDAVICRREEHEGWIAAKGVLHRFEHLRVFIRWMADRAIWRFSALMPSDLELFTKALSIRGQGGRLPATQTIRAWLRMFSDMWTLRGRYPAPLRFNPELLDWYKSRIAAGRPGRRWRPIETNIALPLIRDAITWVDEVAPLILAATDDVGVRIRRQNFVGVSKSSRTKAIAQCYRETRELAAYRELCKRMGLDPDDVRASLAAATNLTTGAVLSIVILLTGMRLGEILGLRKGCVSWHVHSDGHQYSYINGTLEKRNGQCHRWVASAPVTKALELMRRLYESQGNGDWGHVFLARSSMLPFPFPHSRCKKLSSSSAARLFQDFARSTLRTRPLSASQRIHPHQGRKTFAKFVSLRDKRGLDAVSQHYGHTHRALTDSAYVGTDLNLVELLDAASLEDLSAALSDLLTATSIGGKAGSAIEDFGNRARSREGFRGKRSLKSLVESLIESGIQLGPCDWGYCLYIKGYSACGGGDNGPNEGRRSPDVCAGCRNFAVTPKHRGWWEARYEEDEAFLKRTSIPIQSKELVLARLNRTAELLAELNHLQEEKNANQEKSKF